MLVRVKLHGDGTEQNPYRVPLPTYTLVLGLIDEGKAYAIIPDETHPDLMAHQSARVSKTTSGSALVGMDGSAHSKWYAHLDDRYQEHRGKFRPEVA